MRSPGETFVVYKNILKNLLITIAASRDEIITNWTDGKKFFKMASRMSQKNPCETIW